MVTKALKQLKKPYEDVIQAITKAGGRFLFVGGCVRDAFLGHTIKDYDAEVYNLEPEILEEVLKTIGPVSFAGKNFGVYHLHHRHLEISIPRKDQKIGTGHRGFKIIADPNLSFQEASQRRDLTMNSMGYDPINEELLDPWRGQEDIKNKVLRATDPKTFGEDPLRALRVMQLTARFLMKPDDVLLNVCANQDLSELASERVLEEFRKLLVKGKKPSWGFSFLKESGLLKYVEGLKDINQKSWEKLLACVDQARGLAMEGNFGFMLTVMAYFMPGDSVKSFLSYLNVSNDLRKEVGQGYELLQKIPDLERAYDWRYWAYKIHKGFVEFKHMQSLIDLLFTDSTLSKFKIAEKEYNLADASKMLPIVQGQDLIDKGLEPGKEFSKILQKCHAYQLREGCFDKKTILASV
jgi:tRNA nucleotidyltransferase (CCA-adding enzyme)